MDDGSSAVPLSDFELREVARYAAACARPALPIFENALTHDGRPRTAIEAAESFANGAKRSKLIRDCAWAAQRAAQEVKDAALAPSASAARAALSAAAAAYLHPIPRSTQVKHILGAAAQAAHAFELEAGGTSVVGTEHVDQAVGMASPIVRDVLSRYPRAPSGGGRVGALIRQIDAALR